jgi:hypothetical protein
MNILKIIKLLAPLLISGLFAMPSHATQIEDTLSWAHLDDGSAIVKYSSDYGEEIKSFEAEISHSSSGEQRLYFYDLSSLGDSLCTYESSVPKSTTMTFNGQAVKMLRWCRKYTDSRNYYLSYTPETDRGHTYVVNLFKTALLPIKIQYNNETLRFPVTGFTKAWNSGGGNAI